MSEEKVPADVRELLQVAACEQRVIDVSNLSTGDEPYVEPVFMQGSTGKLPGALKDYR